MSQSVSDIEALLVRLKGREGQDSDEPEAIAEALLKRNRKNALGFLRTPFHQRLVLLPQCLRAPKVCIADDVGGEYVCRKCGACKIAAIMRRSEELGYMDVKILKGGSALARIIKQTSARAVLGVACPVEGIMSIILCERAGVPAFCVPLLRDGCCDTDVDLPDVFGTMETFVK